MVKYVKAFKTDVIVLIIIICLTDNFEYQNLFVYTDNTIKIKEIPLSGQFEIPLEKSIKRGTIDTLQTHKYVTLTCLVWYRNFN